MATFEEKSAARHEKAIAGLVSRAEDIIRRVREGQNFPNDHMIDPDQLSMLERANAHGHQAVSPELGARARRVAAEYLQTVLELPVSK